MSVSPDLITAVASGVAAIAAAIGGGRWHAKRLAARERRALDARETPRDRYEARWATIDERLHEAELRLADVIAHVSIVEDRVKDIAPRAHAGANAATALQGVSMHLQQLDRDIADIRASLPHRRPG